MSAFRVPAMATTPTRDSLLFFIAILLLLTFVDQTESAPFLLVTKDPLTLQYTTVINQRTPLIPVKLTINLGSGLSWVNCDCEYGHCYESSSYRHVPCGSTLCQLGRSNSCRISCFDPPGPNCNNNTCVQLAENPFIGRSYSEEMATDAAVLWSTDGRNPVLVPVVFVFVCGESSLLEGLSTNSRGIVGLGRSRVSLPAVLSDNFRFPNIYAICLNSSPRSRGIIVFGDGPYFLHSGEDVSQYLTYTPLLLNPVSTTGVYPLGEPSADYFINVTGVHVDGLNVPLNSTLLKISQEGYGGTKLSTVDPYMVMETSIFQAVAGTFVYLLSYLKRVDAVMPFEYCFSLEGVSPVMPVIDLVLENSNFWRIFGANSMVLVKEDVMCLGIVDGGANPITSIVIGGHQLEETLVQIDMAKKRLGFTASLLFIDYTCADLNLTAA